MISKRDILKIESLLFLQAISEAGSKREVAGQLGTSVDTLNKYLSEFETEMKTKFLISNGRGTVITPEGKRMLDIAQDVVRAVRSMDDYAEEADAYSGVVRLAMPDAIADYIGMREVGEFIRKYPDLSFENNITNEMPDIGALEADICINYEPLSHPDAVTVATKEIGCGLFASPKYIEEHGTPRDMDDLLANHFIIAKSSHEKYAPGWSELLEKARHVIYRTNSVFSFRHALKAGIGVGVSPVSYAAQQFIYLKHLDFDFKINLCLMGHKDTKDMPRIRVVLDYLKNILKSRPN